MNSMVITDVGLETGLNLKTGLESRLSLSFADLKNRDQEKHYVKNIILLITFCTLLYTQPSFSL